MAHKKNATEAPNVSQVRKNAYHVLTGDPLPMEVKPHLPQGAVAQDDGWLLLAPEGDLVVDLPACG